MMMTPSPLCTHRRTITKWDEHRVRVEWTVDRLNTFLETHTRDIVTVNDLSCGDGTVLRNLRGPANKVYGDISPGQHLDVVGPIEQTIMQRRGDMLICSETLEHLNDPDLVLEWASERFTWIAITTPLGETDSDKNHEHYWGWDLWGVSAMLFSSGWLPRWVDTLTQPFYTYQLWIARSAWD